MSRSRDLANLAGDATGLETLTVSDITDLTATAAELNKLDGVTASTAELNKLTGVTADTNELNLLDGVTATTAELNYTDGVSSALQTQINAKASLSGATFTGDVTASNVLATNLKHASSGSNNIVLASDGSIARSKTISFFMHAPGTQTVSSDQWPPNKILGNSSNSESFENHYGSSNLSSDVFTVSVAGVYLLGAHVSADYGTGGPRQINDARIFFNYTPSGGSQQYATISGEHNTNTVDDIVYLNGSLIKQFGVGDSFHFGYYFSESGLTATILAGSYYWGVLLF